MTDLQMANEIMAIIIGVLLVYIGHLKIHKEDVVENTSKKKDGVNRFFFTLYFDSNNFHEFKSVVEINIPIGILKRCSPRVSIYVGERLEMTPPHFLEEKIFNKDENLYEIYRFISSNLKRFHSERFYKYAEIYFELKDSYKIGRDEYLCRGGKIYCVKEY